MKKLLLIFLLPIILFSCKKEENKTLIGKWLLTDATCFTTFNKDGKDSGSVVGYQQNVESKIFENTYVDLDNINVYNTTWEFTGVVLILNDTKQFNYHLLNTDKTYIDVTTNPTKRVFAQTYFNSDDLILNTTNQYITGMDGSHKTTYSVLKFKRK